MTQGRKTGGRDFEPGNTFGKGRPQVPEDLKELRKLTKPALELMMNRLIFLPVPQLKIIKKGRNTPSIEKILCNVIIKAVAWGDIGRLGFLLDRLIGKVPDKIEADILHLVEQVKYLRELPKEELQKLANDAMKDSIEDATIFEPVKREKRRNPDQEGDTE